MDIPSWAVRGAKVICIADGFDEDPTIVDPRGLLRFPRLGFEYTIREVRVRYVSERSEVAVGILLREIENPIADCGSATGEEPGFAVQGFQPVKGVRAEVERELEVS